jgi:hypothetical protein
MIVKKRMLAWEQNKFTLYTGSTNKELAIVMETREGIFEHIKISGCEGVMACNVAKIKKHRYTFDNHSRDMSCDRTKVNL